MAAHANGLPEQALGDYLAAAELYAAAGDELEVARVRRSLVDVYQMSGEPEQAIEAADLARPVFVSHGEDRLLAQLETNVGNVFVRLDDYPLACEHYGRAVTGFDALGDEVGTAFTAYNLAVVQTNANQCDEAEAAFRRAQVLMERNEMLVPAADCVYMLAYLESRRGRFAVAIEGLEHSRELYAENGKPSGAPLCDLDLAEIYMRLGAMRDCLKHALAGAQGLAGLEMNYERAKADVFASLAYAALGQEGAALVRLEAAQATFIEQGNRAWPAILEIHRSAMYPGQGDPVELLGSLSAAREALAEQGLRLWSDLATSSLARIFVTLGELGRAQAELDKLDLKRTGELDQLVRVEALAARAELLLAREKGGEAVADLKRAVETVEETWGEVPGSDVRQAFFRDRHNLYAQLAELLAREEGDAERAFELLEQGRLRSFREKALGRGTESCGQREGQARSAEGDSAAGSGSKVSGELEAARERLDWLLGRYLDTRIGPAASDHELAAVGPSDEELRKAEREVVRIAGVTRPEGGRNTSHVFSVDSLRSVLDPTDCVVAFLLSESGTRAFLVRQDGVSSAPLSVTPDTVRSLRERLSFQLEKFRLGPDYAARHADRLLDSSRRVLDELGRLLLKPLEHELAGCRLTILPYGELHTLPVHAFRLGGEWLASSHEVGYALSAGQLIASRSQARPAAITCALAGAEEDALPAIKEELAAIARLLGERASALPPEKVRAFLSAGGARNGLLHVASHGLFRPENPVFSGLRLGNTFVTAHDIAGADMTGSLVTLSGCDTGLLLQVGGEELFGLTRALFGSGARTVITSLWPVADADTAAFMGLFYGALSAGAPAGQAVSDAWRERMQETPHPFAWAPFALSGDPLFKLA
ncbi:MAG: CHAT domain-containing protein [Planctomycetota bacterium]|nr:CHAT domain-containing protein [Planctomycetota bacterium]